MSPIFDISLKALKIILSAATVIALYIWITKVGLALFYYYQAGGPQPYWYWGFALFPIIYLLFCLISCTPILKGRTLVITGLAVHVGLIVWIATGIIHAEYIAGLVHGLIFTFLWILVCVGRVYGEKGEKLVIHSTESEG